MKLGVSIQMKKVPHASPKVKVYYPILFNLKNSNVQMKINHAILNTLNKMLIEQNYYDPSLQELMAYYEIKTNERGILSLNLIVYSFTGGAHGMTIVKSLTFDIETGKLYSLKDLFKPGSDYVKR
jgi:hypothetical protein